MHHVYTRTYYELSYAVIHWLKYALQSDLNLS